MLLHYSSYFYSIYKALFLFINLISKIFVNVLTLHNTNHESHIRKTYIQYCFSSQIIRNDNNVYLTHNFLIPKEWEKPLYEFTKFANKNFCQCLTTGRLFPIMIETRSSQGFERSNISKYFPLYQILKG